MRIVISSGHGKYVRGASGLIDEVDEARKVVPCVADYLREAGHQIVTFNDDTSTSQSENLDTIIAFHNSQGDRQLDCSVHFNAAEPTDGARGCEVLYVTQEELAAKVSEAIAEAGDLIDRGAKYRDDLAFLNQTDAPAILLEICFVDAGVDVTNYQANFSAICRAIADVADDVAGRADAPEDEAIAYFSGPCSWFGGPEDDGVDPDEGLAFFDDVSDAPHLFLPHQPPGTTGLARRLNPTRYYVACRWDYDKTPKEMLADKDKQALVRANDRELLAWPADWGPHEDTGRAADISPGLMDALGIDTDDSVEVIYPAPSRPS